MVLDSFTRLNEIVSIHRPDDQTNKVSSPIVDLLCTYPPSTILILSWAGAAPRHIEKYAAMYIERFPTARIVLVTSGLENFIYRSNRVQQTLVAPAIDALAETPDDALLVHVLSNGGAKQWCTINTAYQKATGRPLLACATIIDSAPGGSTFRRSWAALDNSLSGPFIVKTVSMIVFGTVLCLMYLATYSPGNSNVVQVMRKELNDAELISLRGRRCYIYSKEDKIISWKDVEDHAEEARQKGWDVTLVKYTGSNHVGHLRQDRVKYWNSVKKVWDKNSE
jgi:hypothetical protein